MNDPLVNLWNQSPFGKRPDQNFKKFINFTIKNLTQFTSIFTWYKHQTSGGMGTLMFVITGGILIRKSLSNILIRGYLYTWLVLYLILYFHNRTFKGHFDCLKYSHVSFPSRFSLNIEFSFIALRLWKVYKWPGMNNGKYETTVIRCNISAVKPLNSGHLRVLKICPLLRCVRYWEVI